MLLAAGFAAPAPIEIPFAERVQRAQQLRADGLSWAEIGELLGVGADTARRYVHVHSCECGEPILARDARLCRRCSSRHRTRWGRVFTERGNHRRDPTVGEIGGPSPRDRGLAAG